MASPHPAVHALDAAFRAAADPARAAAMRAYMRDMFPFAGIPAPARRALQKAPFAPLARAPQDEVLAVAAELWTREHREMRYAACDLLTRAARRLDATAAPALERLLTTDPWWDTVDHLATRVAGPIARRDPAMRPVVDAWLASPDPWLRRAALLHQVGARGAADGAWLLAACERCAADTGFFIRKAIGWALRDHAATDPAAVRAFVEAMGDRLSPLSRREALRGVERAQARPTP